jgi:hypothetical protein
VTLLAKPADALAELRELGTQERWLTKDVELELCGDGAPVRVFERSPS